MLAIHALAEGANEDAVKETLGRVAEAAADRGWRAIETFYSLERGRAYTYAETDTADRVRDTLDDLGLAGVEVLEAERVFTELLHRPRRSR